MIIYLIWSNLMPILIAQCSNLSCMCWCAWVGGWAGGLMNNIIIILYNYKLVFVGGHVSLGTCLGQVWKRVAPFRRAHRAEVRARKSVRLCTILMQSHAFATSSRSSDRKITARISTIRHFLGGGGTGRWSVCVNAFLPLACALSRMHAGVACACVGQCAPIEQLNRSVK
jgi:hypothetical protein